MNQRGQRSEVIQVIKVKFALWRKLQLIVGTILYSDWWLSKSNFDYLLAVIASFKFK